MAIHRDLVTLLGEPGGNVSDEGLEPAVAARVAAAAENRDAEVRRQDRATLLGVVGDLSRCPRAEPEPQSCLDGALTGASSAKKSSEGFSKNSSAGRRIVIALLRTGSTPTFRAARAMRKDSPV